MRNATCSGLCSTCDVRDGSLCLTCVENAIQKFADLPAVCECDQNSHLDEGKCLRNAVCLGLCRTCDEKNGSICLTCIENAAKHSGDCKCKENWYEEEGVCVPNAQCSGLCMTCDKKDGSLCQTCVENARMQAGDKPGTCECEDGSYPENGQCVKNAVCTGLCETCDKKDGSLCFTCVQNAVKPSQNQPGSCICDSSYYEDAGSCIKSAVCFNLCATCDQK